jgi:hypothetical protein
MEIMTRTLEQIVSSELIEYYDCVAVNIDATHNYYYTQAPYDLSLTDGNTYKAAGGLLSISEYVDNTNFSIEKLAVGLAGIVDMQGDLSVLETIQTLEYIDKPVTIYRAFMDEHKVAHTVVLFKGYINGINAVFNTEGESTQASIDISSHWTDFDRVSTRYTNSKSQQEFFPTDLGFDYAVDVQKEVTWKENG